MNYYLQVLKKYAVFSGRATRSEYWYFILFNILISIGISIFITVVSESLEFVSSLYALAVVIPSIAVAARRLHDTGRSAWWLLIAFVPLIGAIVLLIFFVGKSEEDSNKYGSNPKGVSAPEMSSV